MKKISFVFIFVFCLFFISQNAYANEVVNVNVSGIEQGGIYTDTVTITIEGEGLLSARLNNDVPSTNNPTVLRASKTGDYTLVVEDTNGYTKTYQFTIDKTSPVVKDVIDNGIYNKDIELDFYDYKWDKIDLGNINSMNYSFYDGHGSLYLLRTWGTNTVVIVNDDGIVEEYNFGNYTIKAHAEGKDGKVYFIGSYKDYYDNYKTRLFTRDVNGNWLEQRELSGIDLSGDSYANNKLPYEMMVASDERLYIIENSGDTVYLIDTNNVVVPYEEEQFINVQGLLEYNGIIYIYTENEIYEVKFEDYLNDYNIKFLNSYKDNENLTGIEELVISPNNELFVITSDWQPNGKLYIKSNSGQWGYEDIGEGLCMQDYAFDSEGNFYIINGSNLYMRNVNDKSWDNLWLDNMYGHKLYIDKDVIYIYGGYDKGIYKGTFEDGIVESNDYKNVNEIFTNSKGELTILYGPNNSQIEYVSKEVHLDATATLNGVKVDNGYIISEEGLYFLEIRDQANHETTLTFTIDKTAPSIIGVEDQEKYNSSVTVGIVQSNNEEYNVYINNTPVSIPYGIEEDGFYEVRVIDEAGNINVKSFVIDKKAPTISGVEDKWLYNKDLNIKLSDYTEKRFISSNINELKDFAVGNDGTMYFIDYENSNHKLKVLNTDGSWREVSINNGWNSKLYLDGNNVYIGKNGGFYYYDGSNLSEYIIDKDNWRQFKISIGESKIFAYNEYENETIYIYDKLDLNKAPLEFSGGLNEKLSKVYNVTELQDGTILVVDGEGIYYSTDFGKTFIKDSNIMNELNTNIKTVEISDDGTVYILCDNQTTEGWIQGTKLIYKNIFDSDWEDYTFDCKYNFHRMVIVEDTVFVSGSNGYGTFIDGEFTLLSNEDSNIEVGEIIVINNKVFFTYRNYNNTSRDLYYYDLNSSTVNLLGKNNYGQQLFYVNEIEDNSIYLLSGSWENKDIYVISPSEITATLQKDEETIEFNSDFIVSEEGRYILSVTDDIGNTQEISFEIDKTAPVITGVENGEKYSSDIPISFFGREDEKLTARLNGRIIYSPYKIKTDGVYVLEVSDEAGNKSSVSFVRDTLPPVAKGINSGDSINEDVTISFGDYTKGLLLFDDLVNVQAFAVAPDGTMYFIDYEEDYNSYFKVLTPKGQWKEYNIWCPQDSEIIIDNEDVYITRHGGFYHYNGEDIKEYILDEGTHNLYTLKVTESKLFAYHRYMNSDEVYIFNKNDLSEYNVFTGEITDEIGEIYTVEELSDNTIVIIDNKNIYSSSDGVEWKIENYREELNVDNVYNGRIVIYNDYIYVLGEEKVNNFWGGYNNEFNIFYKKITDENWGKIDTNKFDGHHFDKISVIDNGLLLLGYNEWATLVDGNVDIKEDKVFNNGWIEKIISIGNDTFIYYHSHTDDRGELYKYDDINDVISLVDNRDFGEQLYYIGKTESESLYVLSGNYVDKDIYQINPSKVTAKLTLNGENIEVNDSVLNLTEEGQYELKLIDNVGNIGIYEFTIDKTAPVLEVIKTDDEPERYVVEYNEGDLYLNGIKVDESNRIVLDKAGVYNILVKDSAGNITEETVKIDLLYSGVQHGDLYFEEVYFYTNAERVELDGRLYNPGDPIGEGIHELRVYIADPDEYNHYDDNINKKFSEDTRIGGYRIEYIYFEVVKYDDNSYNSSQANSIGQHHIRSNGNGYNIEFEFDPYYLAYIINNFKDENPTTLRLNGHNFSINCYGGSCYLDDTTYTDNKDYYDEVKRINQKTLNIILEENINYSYDYSFSINPVILDADNNELFNKTYTLDLMNFKDFCKNQNSGDLNIDNKQEFCDAVQGEAIDDIQEQLDKLIRRVTNLEEGYNELNNRIMALELKVEKVVGEFEAYKVEFESFKTFAGYDDATVEIIEDTEQSNDVVGAVFNSFMLTAKANGNWEEVNAGDEVTLLVGKSYKVRVSATDEDGDKVVEVYNVKVTDDGVQMSLEDNGFSIVGFIENASSEFLIVAGALILILIGGAYEFLNRFRF